VTGEHPRLDRLARRADIDEPPDLVLQLADVPRPGVRGQRAQRFYRDAANGLAGLAREGADELLHERGDVVAPVAQRRDLHRVAGHAVVEVAAEAAVVHALL